MEGTEVFRNTKRRGSVAVKTVPRLSESPVPKHLASRMTLEEWQCKMRLLEDVFTAAYRDVDVNGMVRRNRRRQAW